MTYDTIINKVSEDLGLPVKLVNNTYKAFWLFIRNSIQELPLKENISEEDFNKLKTNFNIPSLGKLCVTYDRMLSIKQFFKYDKYKED